METDKQAETEDAAIVLTLLGEVVAVDLGSVEEVTLGNSASGSADANTQYYW